MIATIFDCESTSLIDNHVIRIDKQPYMLEIFATHVDLKTGKIHDEMEHLIRPPNEKCIDIEIAKKSHGILWEEVKDKPKFAEIGDSILTFLSRAPAIIAHNISFDAELVDIDAERMNRKMFWPERRICTLEQTTFVKGTWLNLSDLYEHLFGLRFEGAHRAKNDVQALTKCCVELFQRGWI